MQQCMAIQPMRQQLLGNWEHICFKGVVGDRETERERERESLQFMYGPNKEEPYHRPFSLTQGKQYIEVQNENIYIKTTAAFHLL